jgi:amidophosphoribosyltransferase
MCGIVGIVARNEVKQDIYDALTILQHRGQDAAGMVTSDGRHCYLRKDNGLVKDVFQGQHMQRLQGKVGIRPVPLSNGGLDQFGGSSATVC